MGNTDLTLEKRRAQQFGTLIRASAQRLCVGQLDRTQLSKGKVRLL